MALNPDIEHITLVKWTTDEYKKILNYVTSHKYHIKEWVRFVCMNEIKEGKLEYEKIHNRFAELEKLSKKEKHIKSGIIWLTIMFCLMILLNLILFFYAITPKSDGKSNVISLINECPIINGEIIEEKGKIGCEVINTPRNQVILNLLCRKYGLNYVNGTDLKCI